MNFLLFISILFLLNFINTQNNLNLINAFSPPNDIIWDSETYPNPLSDEEYFKCNIKNKTYLCDPENLLTKESRRNIIEELKILRNSKGFSLWRIFQKCKRQGFIGGVAIANTFVGGNSETLKFHANKLLKKWKMDEICKKSFLILIATKDRSFWISKDSNIPIHSNFFTKLFNEQKEEFRSGNYEKAIINLIHSISNAVQTESEKGEFGNEMVFVYCKYIFFAFIIGSCLYCCCHNVKFSAEGNGYQSGSIYYSSNNHYSDNRRGEESGGCDSGGGGGDW